MTITYYKQSNDNQVDVSRRPFGFIMSYVLRHSVAHAGVIISVVAAVAFAAASQYAVKHLVDVLSAHDVDAVWGAFALLSAMIACDNLTWRIGSWIASHVFVTVTGDIRRDLFEHLTGHSPAYFAERLPGMLAARITATANAIYTVESAFAWNILPPILAVTFSIAILATVDPIMALCLVAASAILAAVLVKWAAGGWGLHHAYAHDAASVDGELVDVINNMPLVRAFGATLGERARFAGRVRQEMNSRGRSLRYLERLRVFHAVATAAMTALLLAWGVHLWVIGAASTGDVVLVSTLGCTILHSTRDLAVALVDTTQHVARLSEALATLLLPHQLRDAQDARQLSTRRGEVEFRHVSFSYSDGAPVLRNFDLHIKAGTRVGVVGRSGSGKSTMLTLMQRLRDINEGQILIDGHDISRITQESLHDVISVVPQDVMLFHRTVMENIRYGRPEASDREVYAAAEAAGCREFITALSEGYDTMVGDRGIKLSGGQRQRLAIARAFLRDAPVLLLDEATSALDTESEQAVQRALDRLMHGRTVIAVAHRLSTLKDFDRIVVMQNGRILQDGSPRELENTQGAYHDLLYGPETQKLRAVA